MLNIPNPFKSKREVQSLRTEVRELQHEISILISGMEEVSAVHSGNPYATYKEAITELAKKYEGTALWGVQQTRNIIDLRAAFTIGQGITPVLKETAKTATRELEFIQEFLSNNDIDLEMSQEFAKEAEIEGRFLARLIPNKEKDQIDLRYVSYTKNNYEVVTATDDYKVYTEVKYHSNSQEVKLTANEFVYKKFGGRVNKVNEIMPKVASILRYLEDIDKALKDWRDINHLFAGPTPHFKTESKAEADALYKALSTINWKLGKMLVTTAEFSLVSADKNGVESLEKEIVTLAKLISGAIGIPVHFLGLPELMSNRAVSTDLFELITASTSRERKVWKGGYEEIFEKVLKMANSKLQKGFQTDAIGCDIPYVTEQKMKELVEVWLPLYTADAIDMDTMLSKIPEVNGERIKKNIEEKQANDIKRLQDSMNQNADDEGEDDGEK